MKRLALLLFLSSCSPSEPGVSVFDRQAVDSAEPQQLRALATTEIIGDITPGETKVVAYTENPTFRAFRLKGSAGDELVATVSADGGGRPAVWLVDAKFTTLWHSYASTSSTSIAYTLTADGIYFLVFRDTDYEDHEYTVELEKAAAEDPFDPTWCSGVPMTEAAAKARFAPGARTSLLGKYSVYSRERSGSCNSVSGCPAWKPAKLLSKGRALFWLNTSESPALIELVLEDEGNAGPCEGELFADGFDISHFRAVGLPDVSGSYGMPYFDSGTCWGAPWSGRLKGVLTDHCARLSGLDRWTSLSHPTGQMAEDNFAIQLRF